MERAAERYRRCGRPTLGDCIKRGEELVVRQCLRRVEHGPAALRTLAPDDETEGSDRYSMALSFVRKAIVSPVGRDTSAAKRRWSIARGASPWNRSVFRAASPEGAADTEANHTVAPSGLTYRLPFKPGADAPGY